MTVTVEEPTTAAPLVRLTDAGKNYGNILALQGVTLEVSGGEVTCVLGDNGAGKSTLIKIIAGLHQHSEGTYEVEGQPVHFTSPREALNHGIATVYQDLAVVPLMPVFTTRYPLMKPMASATTRETTTPTHMLAVNWYENIDATRAELVTATPADRSNSPPIISSATATAGMP